MINEFIVEINKFRRLHSKRIIKVLTYTRLSCFNESLQKERRAEKWFPSIFKRSVFSSTQTYSLNDFSLTGRFVSNCPNRNEIPVEPRPHPNPPPIVIQKGAEARRTADGLFSPAMQRKEFREFFPLFFITEINDEEKKIDEPSPIKSPSYMDELRQRLERVLHDQSQEKPTLSRAPPFSPNLPPSTETRRIKNPTTIGSTPLPRKQLTTVGNLSYRTINPPNRYPSSQMSKSFTIPTKREGRKQNTRHFIVWKRLFFLENRSSSSLSIASNSESLSLDETDFKIPTTTLHKSTTNIIKSKTNVSNSTQINRSKTNLTQKKSNNGITSPTLKLSNSIVSTRSTNKFIHSTIPTSSSCTSKIAPIAAMKPLPLVPPRKSSISNSTMSTSQRDLFTSSNSYRRTHVSHLWTKFSSSQCCSSDVLVNVNFSSKILYSIDLQCVLIK